MKLVASGNEFNSIRNAIDKEAKITMMNMELMDKMDYILEWSVNEKVIQTIGLLFDDSPLFDPKTTDKNLIKTIVKEILKTKYDDDEILESELEILTQNTKIFPKAFFEQNPYLNNIKLEDMVYEDLKILISTYPKYQVAKYSAEERKNLIYYPRWGFMQCDATTHAMIDNVTNKSITALIPSEMFQIQEYIDNATGKVLLLGLKFGYYAYMTALKEVVSEITIIEENKTLIDYFNTYIFPQFDDKAKSKIKIINCDPIEYIKHLPDGGFDYCFVDLWIKPYDSEPYFKLKRYHNKFKNMKIEYYKEIDVIINLYETVGLNIYLALQKRNGITPKEDTLVDTFSEYSDIYKLEIVEELFKDYKIKVIKDLMNLYNFQFILNKVNSIKYVEDN